MARSQNSIAKEIADLQRANIRLRSDNLSIIDHIPDLMLSQEKDAKAHYQANNAAIEANHKRLAELRGMLR